MPRNYAPRYYIIIMIFNAAILAREEAYQLFVFEQFVLIIWFSTTKSWTRSADPAFNPPHAEFLNERLSGESFTGRDALTKPPGPISTIFLLLGQLSSRRSLLNIKKNTHTQTLEALFAFGYANKGEETNQFTIKNALEKS